MKIITSGSDYIDIDAYACMIAYSELLRIQGEDAIAFSTSRLNESISTTVQSWDAPVINDYSPSEDDTFILVDASNPSFLDKKVKLNKVSEVIDHHLGFERYWLEIIEDRLQIEYIGAACTLIYERWKESGLFDFMTTLSARLLVCGIIDNTLNFSAKITTLRDIEAYNELITKAELPYNWTAQYFRECQESILKDIVKAIKNDTKILAFKSLGKTVSFGQLVVWNGKKIITEQQEQLNFIISDQKYEGLINIVSVEERISYFITDYYDIQDWLKNLLGIDFIGSVGKAVKPWLRKEIVKKDILYTS